MVSALDRNVSGSIERIDLTLRTVVDEVEHQLAMGGLDEKAIDTYLARILQRVPEAEGFRVTDSDGLIIVGNGVTKRDKITVRGREYFTYLHNNKDDVLKVSKPILGRVVNHYIIVFAHRYNYPDGTFAGVVYATISINHFNELLSQFKLGPNDTLVLRDADFGLIARYPDISSQPSGKVGATVVSPEFRQLSEAGARSATYHTVTPTDGVERTLTFRRLEVAPMFVVVGLASKDYLADWATEVQRTLAVDFGFLLLSSLSGGVLRRSVTATLRESDRLKHAQTQLRIAAIAFETQESMLVTDAQRVILRVNGAFTEATGYSMQDVVGQTPSLLKSDRHDAEFYRRMWESVIRDGGWKGEVWNRRKNGEIYPVWLTISVVTDGEGVVTNYVGVVADITERKRTETALEQLNDQLEERVAERTQELQAAQTALRRLNDQLEARVAERTQALQVAQDSVFRVQRLEAVGQLTGGVAHDFNNLLTVVAGALELLKRPGTSEGRSEKLLALALNAVDRGARLTRSLLAFSRRQTLNTEPLDANALIQESMTLVARAAGEAIRLELLLDPALPACQADAAQLEAALINLVINACDAMPAGGELSIATRRAVLSVADLAENPEASPGEFVAIAVTDTGSGMSEDVKAHAFEPFYTTKEPGKGTGLGLSQVFGFVRQLGGHVAIDTGAGQGTTVTLYLPCATALAGCPEHTEGKQEAEMSMPSNATVLIVEDEEAVRDVTAEMLRSVGCHVLAVSDGPAALDLLRQGQRIDLLLTDVVMPGGMTGVELARDVRQIQPSLPVLLTSGYAGAVLERHGAVAGEFEVIGKPYRFLTLRARVAELTSGNRPAPKDG